MTKKEILWREILHQAIDNKKIEFTQKDLSEKFRISLSTVFNALKVPRQSGAVKVTGRNFLIQDKEKFLYFWATQRNLTKEIIYSTNVAKNPNEIEGLMPQAIIFGAYSAYAKKYRESPADYDKVYIYADPSQLAEVKKRFPQEKGQKNLFVLKADACLKDFGENTPDVQTFADLWNLSDWYAKDFLKCLKEKMNLI
ncbi:hypothetical protein KKD19_07070 [Patescibacteria group bacterium]|nr:hypothetical protein [Patescibacteria group bacterium]MBU4512965.1 hypothetical protein [Patescibacteria group bacterium]MCG2693001.1 hypothetical protein [Candidatus Parcubacteria bacterium]